MTRSIVFDVDDTLYDQLLPFKQAVKKTLSVHLTDKDMFDLYVYSRHYSDAVFEQEQRGEISTLDLQVHRITEAAAHFDLHLSHGEAVRFQEAYLAYQQEITLIPEIEELLNLLSHHGITLAILSNGNSAHQQMKIDQLNMHRWVNKEHQFISGSTPYQKPDPAIFKWVEKELALTSNAFTYVGDTFLNDIVGAKRANWQAVWFNHRNRKPTQTEVKADFTANTAEALLKYFKEKS